MNYLEWAEEYYENARRIFGVIEKRKAMLKNASKDERKQLQEDILKYRSIYYDLMRTAEHLAQRAEKESEDAA